MADIDVVKKGSRMWMWVVMVAVLALVIWFLFMGNSPDTYGMIQAPQPDGIAYIAAASTTAVL